MLSKVEKIIASETNPELASGVVVNGSTLPADFVIMGVGVAPATQYLKGSGVELERDGGIRVDKYMRVKTGKDTKNVYAIGAFTCLKEILFLLMIPGDIAIYPHTNGDEVRIEHWNVRNFVFKHLNNIDSLYDIRLLQIKVEL